MSLLDQSVTHDDWVVLRYQNGTFGISSWALPSNERLAFQLILPGILEEGDARNASSSYASLISTLVPLLVISGPLLLTFLYLRVKLRRVYAPRTFIETLHDEEKTPKLEKNGFVNWMPEFWRRPDEEILDHQNLDGYLFVQFMKTITFISFVGLCLTIPLLIIDYTGGGEKTELASLTISNVKDPMMFYFHCLIAIVFFGKLRSAFC